MKRSIQCSLALISLAVLVAIPWSNAKGDEHAYVGTKNCRKCHLKEHKSWAETKMANSFDNLKPGERAEAKTKAGLDPNKDYTKDPECLRCHTTGYGKEGGFVDIETTPDLAGVGCEMCHGPGGTYTLDEHMSLKNREYKKAAVVAVGLVGEITVQQCQGCHNADSPFVGDDYVFDFESRKNEGTHEKLPLKYNHE